MPATIRFLGTGTAFNTDGRASQAIFIRPRDGAPFLVDAGPTVTASLHRDGVDPEPLDGLFITHLHGDHTAGWPFLLLHFVMADRRTRPFEVVGPPGTQDCLETLERACYGKLLSVREFDIRFTELPVREATGLEASVGPAFDVVPMVHHPTSIAYRFNFRAARVAITGDTAWCPPLEQLAQGSDLSIVECTTVEKSGIAHVSLDELREGRERLGAGDVILVHLTNEVADELERNPIPQVRSAVDGVVLELGR